MPKRISLSIYKLYIINRNYTEINSEFKQAGEDGIGTGTMVVW